ncbi:MAG: M20/M25/M40 family metallo-hydrolase [Sinobacteraceae bacterium]|nr:M20/M25/M40 family metallo-hydrolase [Nevskiaceae bacterium]
MIRNPAAVAVRRATSRVSAALRAPCSVASCLLFWLALSGSAGAKPPADGNVVNRIADEAFNHGEVVEIAAHLADGIGGRMTNSPAMRVAERWTQEKFRSWGLKNVHAEGFNFGRGWWIEAAHVRMLTPRPLELRSIPVAWTPPTHGPLAAPIIVAPMRSPQDFNDWKGKLAGRIVLFSWPEPARDEMAAPFARLSDAELAKLNRYAEPKFDPEALQKRTDRLLFRRKLDAFAAAEGAVGLVRMSRNDGHLVHGEGYSYQVGRTAKLPEVEVAAEDYRRLARLARLGEVRLEIDSRVHFEDADHNAYNIIAELPGRESRAGYVMAGAHLDSWVAGDGAADNGAGSAIVMEAARILSRIGAPTRRTIRFALWAGEEQGLLGSAAYIEQHLAHRPVPGDPELASLGRHFAPPTYPVTPLPGFREMDGYFNIDNGSGKLRGIYAEGNFAAVPLLRDWLAPFESMGAAAVVAEPTTATDHELMSALGLPAFQFIQDPLDYESTVHHTDVDTFDHLRPDDLRQAAVVLATLLLDAANIEQPLPARPLPTQPSITDPFHYHEPLQP